jgi:NADH-quinone oxidoreductase subunit M
MPVLALILLPAAVALALALLKPDARVSKIFGALTAAATAVLVYATRDAEFSYHWLARPFVASFHFGSTAVSFWIVLLLAVVTFCAVLATNVRDARSMIAMLLVLESTMLALFLTRDLLVFALAWDAMLLPVFFCLIKYAEHPQTAWRYFLYNFAGGLTLLFATAAFGVINGSTDVIGTHVHLIGAWAPWIFAGFAFAFLVKTPVFPLHTWMPITYTDTPSPMIAVVSAVQSKAGLYGFLVILLAFMPDYMRAYAPWFVGLALISLLYGAFAALAQNDLKRIVAYSSLSHLGLIVLALFSFSHLAVAGALVYIIAHGLFSAALFLILGYVEEREGTRSLVRLGGIGFANPRLAGALCIAALAALGLPGLAGFVGEIVILTGVYSAGMVWPTILALIPIVLAAAYMLRLFQGIANGPTPDDLPLRRDLTWIEGLAVAPLLLALLALGLDPHALLMGLLP